MAIAVTCRCGKKFKVKDELAGKVVRCPQCQIPLRIPNRQAKPGGPSASATDERANVEAALLKIEETKKKRQLTAEEEAAYRQEQNKLIESYDQLTGRAGPKGKKEKGRPTEQLPKKPTIFTKLADVFAAVFGTLAVRYLIIAGLLGVGGIASILIVQYMTGYMHEESAARPPVEEQVRQALQAARDAVEAKDWDKAEKALAEFARLDPAKAEVHLEYKRMCEQVKSAKQKQGPRSL
jgi:hypothetical protein